MSYRNPLHAVPAACRGCLFAKVCFLAFLVLPAESQVSAQADKKPLPTSIANFSTWRKEGTWLCDIPAENVAVGWGKYETGYRLGYTHRVDGRDVSLIRFRALAAGRSISMHPKSQAEYPLDGKFKLLHGRAGINDTAGDGSFRPVRFRIFADGKQIWESGRRLHGMGDCQPFYLDVTGVQRLKLTIDYFDSPFHARNAHAVWLNPRLDLVPPDPELLERYRPENRHYYRWDQLHEQVENLFVAGKFDELEQLAAAYREKPASINGYGRMRMFHESLAKPFSDHKQTWDEHFTRFESWKKAHPDSVERRIAEAYAWDARGWEARGVSFANKVTEEGWATLRDCLPKARDLLEEARAINPKLPEIYVGRIGCSLGLGEPKEVVYEALEECVKHDPTNLDVHRAMLPHLLTRWGGEPDDLRNYIDEWRRRIGGDDGDVFFAVMVVGFVKGELPQDVFLTFPPKDLEGPLTKLLEKYPEDLAAWNLALSLAIFQNNPQRAKEIQGRIPELPPEPIMWCGRSWASRAFNWARLADAPGPSTHTWFNYNTANGMVFSKDGRRLWSAGMSLHLMGWNLETGAVDKIIRLDDYCSHLRSNPAGDVAAIGHGHRKAGGVTLFDTNTGRELLRTQPESTDPYRSLEISSDGAWLATAGDFEPKVLLRPLKSSEDTRTLDHPEGVFDLTFSPSGKLLATTSAKGGVWVYDAATGVAQGAPLVGVGKGPWYSALRFTPDEKRLVMSASEGTVSVIDLETRKITRKKLPGVVFGLAVAPDGLTVAVGRGTDLEFWSLDPLERIGAVPASLFTVWKVGYSPDGRYVAASDSEGCVRLWKVQETMNHLRETTGKN